MKEKKEKLGETKFGTGMKYPFAEELKVPDDTFKWKDKKKKS